MASAGKALVQRLVSVFYALILPISFAFFCIFAMGYYLGRHDPIERLSGCSGLISRFLVMITDPIGTLSVEGSECFRHPKEFDSRDDQALWPLRLNGHPAVFVESPSALIFG